MTSAKAELADAQRAAMTGLDVSGPSDSPHLWPEIYGVEDGIQDQGQFTDNTATAKTLLNTVDTTLGSATNAVSSALETAVMFSSDVYNANDRQAAAASVDALLDQVIGLGNTDIAGRYVFAGDAYDKPPFTATTGAYIGGSGQPSTRVGSNSWVATGYDGSAIFDNSIKSLQDLSDALRTGTATDVANTLDGLHQSSQELITNRQTAGYDFVAADDASAVAENMGNELKTRLSDLVGADPAEAYSRLAQLQTSYQAILQVTAQGRGQNLFSLL